MELLSIRSRTLTMVFPPAVIGNSYHWFGHVPGLFFMLPVRTVPTQNITTHSGYDRVVNKFHADYKQEQITNPVEDAIGYLFMQPDAAEYPRNRDRHQDQLGSQIVAMH